MSLEAKLEILLNRHEELQTLLATHQNPSSTEYRKLTCEYAQLEKIVPQASALQKAKQQLLDAEAMLQEGDAELQALAQEELVILKKELPNLEHQLRLALLPKDEADERNAIIEIRAGTGGDEAGLFAGDLLRMYERYASYRGWRFELIGGAPAEVGGYKEVSAKISGDHVFERLKFESGVHRVQRVPETESGGRIHTSAATVAVLPEAQQVDVDINTADLRIDTYRSSGAGGQHVNTTDSAVRITHIPTGIVAACQEEKSQHKNRDKAMTMLRARIYQSRREALDAERAANRKSQVGSGDRSERIRTYNFPQGRLTDHRINLTLYKLEQILAGDGLDEVIEALIAEDQAARLADFD